MLPTDERVRSRDRSSVLIGAWQPLPRWLPVTSMWEAVPSGDLFLDTFFAAHPMALK